MSDQSVWLIDLQGQVELADNASGLDGAIIRSSDRSVIAVGVKRGFLGQQTSWAPIDRLTRADGGRAWFGMSAGELSDRPPDGIWLRTGLVVRRGADPLGTLRWLGVVGPDIVEIGIVPRDPRMGARLIESDAIRELNDRSIEVDVSNIEELGRLRTDRELEEEIRRRFWETADSLPTEALDRMQIAVRGGVAYIGGMLPRNEHRDLAVAIAREPFELRGVVNQVETSEDLTLAARRVASVSE